MIKFVITIFILLVVLLSISCPKESVTSSDQPYLAHLKHRPFLTNTMLQDYINNTPSGDYVWEDWLDCQYGIDIYYHKAGDNKGKYMCKLPNNRYDFNDKYIKSYISSYDAFTPVVSKQLFLGVREIDKEDIIKHCRLLQPSEQVEMLNKLIEMNLLTMKNPNYSELINDYTDKNIDKDFIIINVGTTFVSSGYPENKETIDAFVAWFENKYYSTLNKPEYKVSAFPWEGPDLPRPEKY